MLEYQDSIQDGQLCLFLCLSLSILLQLQLVGQSGSYPMDQLVGRLGRYPIGWLVGWSVGRLVCQHAVNRSVGQWVGRSVSWSQGGPIDWSDGELDIGQTASRSISHILDQQEASFNKIYDFLNSTQTSNHLIMILLINLRYTKASLFSYSP